MNNVINEMLSKYEVNNLNDEINALKEVIQEIILCGLSRGGFFNECAFYGGTCLRIFYGLDRFSEDLDFALIKKNDKFDLSKYFKYIENEVKLYGFDLKILKKEKKKKTNIESAFLKGNTLKHVLLFYPNDNSVNKLLKDIKIKFEVDVNPPEGATYDVKFKLLPSIHQLTLYDNSSLFAGKIHAVLCRNWKTRTKGRDLYDYVFFLKNNTPVNMTLLRNKLIDSNYLGESDNFNIDVLRKMLCEKFNDINYEDAKKDVLPFIKDPSVLNNWSSKFFTDITDNIH